jgi:radical SAM protein with 4Fe4S-binding SPASM domain
MEHIVAKLQKLYDTVGPYFLSDFFKPGGQQRLYQFLKSTHRPVFENNFRIILIQDCADKVEYQDLPGLAVCTLQKYLRDIDISNFFVLLVSGNADIGNQLEQARKLYSTDDVPIQHLIVPELNFQKVTGQKKDTFCVLPWMHLYVGPDSNVMPCCIADQSFPMGSINHQSVDTILKSSKFNQLRYNMLNGLKSKECTRCYQQEDAGFVSYRQSNNAHWGQNKSAYNADGTIDKFAPRYLDLRLNNICNLKCRMCSGYFSSAIAQEESELFGNQKYLDNAMHTKQKTMALDELSQYFAIAEKIYFAGGEPLLAAEHYKILNGLIECNNLNLEIVYNTNFTTLTYKHISVTDLWKKFTNITIGASIDAMGDVAEYVRHGTDWNLIEANLKSLKQDCPSVNFTVTSVVGCLNAFSLIDLQKTWHSNGNVDISKFKVTAVLGPNHMTLKVLPPHYKTTLSQKIKTHIIWCKQNKAITLATEWEKVLNYMMSEDHSHFLNEFRRITKMLDQHRNKCFETVFPDLTDLLHYNI